MRKLPVFRRYGRVEPDDVALVRLVASGERTALAALYLRLVGAVRQYVLATIGDPVLTDRIVAGVFVEVWHCARSYPVDRETVEMWLLRVAAGRMFDRFGCGPVLLCADSAAVEYDRGVAVELAVLLADGRVSLLADRRAPRGGRPTRNSSRLVLRRTIR